MTSSPPTTTSPVALAANGRSTPRADDRWDAIVIGSGLGGLTTAAYLTTNGLRTLVLEQYDVVGGCTHVFRRKREWEFDVGVHYIGDCGPRGAIPGALRGVGLEGRIEFLEMDPDGFDTIRFPDLEFRVPKGWDNYRERLVETFPNERAGIEKCVRALKGIAAELMAGGAPTTIVGMMRFALRSRNVMRWQSKTLADLFDSCALGERARAVLAGEAGTYGAPPSRVSVLMHAVLIDHYVRDGAYYPKGGGHVFAAQMLDVIQSHGGDVRTHARVERILIDDEKASGVRLEGGEELRAPVVVSNAGLKNTFLGLLPEESVSQKTLRRVRGYDMALPLFCVYLGLDVDLADAMANTNYLVNPDYDVERWYEDLYAGRVPDEPPLYITAASLKDPYTRAIAPKGCSNVQIMTLAPPHHSFWNVNDGPTAGERYSRSPDYRSVKDELMEKLIDGAGQVIPNVRDHILWKEASTPITQERYTLAAGGTSYGLEHSPKQWGQRRPGFKTELRGLFVVGADTRFAHGVVGVMLGGMGCAGAVLGRDLISEVREGRVFGDPARLTPIGTDFDAFEVCRRHRVKPRSTASKRVPVAA